MKKEKLTIFGLGHIGLPTASLFAKKSFKVTGVDINSQIISKINSGISPIIEPGLDELVKEVVENGNLIGTLDGVDAAKNSNIMIVIVPTPVDENKLSDLSAVTSACENISQGLNKGDLVIIESTVPTHTCDDIVIPILEKSGLTASVDFGVAYTPERALPNNTLYEMTHNARVIGGIDPESTKRAVDLYKNITKGEIVTVNNLVTAEMVKLMENTYRDTNIALANELALICESLNIDVIDAINAANYHPRVNIHTPGPGVGGHCLSIDPYFIVEMAKNKGTPAKLIETSRMINESMPHHVVNLVEKELSKIDNSINGSKIGILGLAYKANVSDIRESPSIEVIKNLKIKGADVSANDPYVLPEQIRKLGAYPVEIDEALSCDCVVLMTEHDDYLSITPELVKSPIFICTRPILSPEEFSNNGISFKGLGRFFSSKSN